MNPTTDYLTFEFPKSGQVANSGIPSSAYLHVPFCRRRCYYCDFPVFVVGDRKNGENSGTIVQYVAVLCQEIAETPNLGTSLKTVFFGGGTPSLLSVSQLSHILETIDGKFGIAAGAEISIEIDPGTFTLEQLRGYAAAGVNRVSLGVQAFQDELLQACGRSHSVAEILESVEIVRSAGIVNFSLDLISGLPHQTLEQWEASLKSAVAISPTHLSSYDLIVEPLTAFGRYFEAGSQPLPADETAAQMYRLAQEILTDAGYEHYEISNYARPGYQCQHNRVYWENRPYYGLGMGAASYVEGRRLTRPRKTQEYYQWVRNLSETTSAATAQLGGETQTDIHPAIEPNFQVSDNDVLLETLMLGLRLAEGVSLSALTEKFTQQTVDKIWHCLQPYWRQGLVEIVNAGAIATLAEGEKLLLSGNLRLSDPEGFLFSNTILADLFSKLEEDN
ncbi:MULTISPECIES: radical SAM family heme chaperone HemW [unclassified Microcoleus]|uniref:radical SAM family heme chaperone HemW n=1 Tax=unclassified Microcoleus TaxID=2642155 RepID=UPI001DB8354B|nr:MULTISPECIES: radical SAM family heme chaperone HemW [unclassified Microcoleus]MCC3421608.1 coproporphyrinogen III oxidase [Microcoleus sp. PH2017_07_MST_O_A]MCC3429543.1 coproporphyrinogen III oxidase [Microcoleus sp. PH2017_04_SCI_O_A]MCC3440453.1 coproporphyrinogen III oxidase [Microcoleus sp. PH2017_03_ELD_O_A]MCC3501752.1 coproporphyrinogen III oxidase [Microcoleus sp. PH2017_19_SFW_U_A]MCC3513220.1 coproporphyrinogen III oxidase [Microcoleus sp. PH2017_17_BER_D_A]TAE11133.1 MAG: copr